MAATFRQDLPPAGGYSSIEWVKQPSFKKINGFKLLGIALGIKAIGYYIYCQQHKAKRLRELELNDARIATSAFMLAESDRGYMKFVRDMREEEEILMKDVPNWKIGMAYDEPIYFNRNPEDIQLVSRREEITFSEPVWARGTIVISGWRPALWRKYISKN